MSQGTPNAPVEASRTSSGYAAALDGKLAHWSGLVFGGNAQTTVTNGTVSGDDALFIGTDTTNGPSDVNVSSGWDAGRVFIVYDNANNAGTNTINIGSSENIDSTSGNHTITTNSGSARLLYTGSEWFTW